MPRMRRVRAGPVGVCAGDDVAGAALRLRDGGLQFAQIETRTYEDVAFRYLAADQHPDHDTFAEFRKRHLEALARLFTQALLLCEKAGPVKLGHVAIDG